MGDAGCALGKVVIQLGRRMGSYWTAMDVKTEEWLRAKVTAQPWNQKGLCWPYPCVTLDCVLSLFKTQFPLSTKRAK